MINLPYFFTLTGTPAAATGAAATGLAAIWWEAPPASYVVSAVVPLVTSGCLIVISLCLLTSTESIPGSRLLRIFAGLLCASGVLHFLVFWHAAGANEDSSSAAGLVTAILLTLAVGLLLRWFRHTARSTNLERIQNSLQEAREQLTREQHLMSALVDNLPDCIYFKDAESRFLRCNQRTADVFGLAGPNDAVGCSDHDFFSREEADEYRADELQIMQTGQPLINKEEYELWRDGTYHWVLSTKLPLRDASGRIIGTFGLSRDISQLKRTEQRLAAKVGELESLHAEYSREQNLFRTLIENIPDAVFFKDREGRFIRVNPAMARNAGMEHPDQMVGLTDADVWQDELVAAARDDERRILQTGQPLIGKQEEVIRKSDGLTRWVLSTKMPLFDVDGETAGTFGLARDITTLKQTQQWLTDSQERFELAAQGTNDGLWDWNILTHEVWYAPRFMELLRLDPIAAHSFPRTLDSLTDRLHPDDRERVLKSLQKHLVSGEPHDEEYRLETADGTYRWFRGRGQARWDEQDRPVRMAGSIQDIHAAHLAQVELGAVRRQLQQALEGGNVGMWDWDILTNKVEVSPELMTQIGRDPEQPWTSLQDWEDCLHPDDREEAKQLTWNYIEGISEEYESSFRLRHASGSYRWILSRGKLFRNEDGKPGRFIGVHVDVTELREAEEALAESEARFRGIFHQTFQFIGLLSPDGTVLDANRTALQNAGITADEVIGLKFWQTVWWIHSDELQRRLQLAIQRAAAGDFDRFEATHPAADGSTIHVDFSLKPVTDEQGAVIYLIPEGRDVTELKKYQQQLKARSDELERSNRELEQFAYVASHDLQEPLRTVVGFCQLLDLEYRNSLDDNGRMYLTTIVEGGRRMQSLITDLLEYSRVGRRGKPFSLTPLQEIMEQVQALLHSAIVESEAQIEVDELPHVHVDVSQMVRLFQNLVGNSLKYRGTEPPRIRIWAENHDSCRKVYVSDNGIGIDRAFSEQIFIIFKRLHTREEYPGTGIGLAVCRRIAERHGGQIRLVYDHPRAVSKSGSTFELTLPAECPDSSLGDTPPSLRPEAADR
ncbi:MAG: PAS domain S-box protein [Fuerstiella sp.]